MVIGWTPSPHTPALGSQDAPRLGSQGNGRQSEKPDCLELRLRCTHRKLSYSLLVNTLWRSIHHSSHGTKH